MVISLPPRTQNIFYTPRPFFSCDPPDSFSPILPPPGQKRDFSLPLGQKTGITPSDIFFSCDPQTVLLQFYPPRTVFLPILPHLDKKKITPSDKKQGFAVIPWTE